ncbi:Ig-like domain-containing protein [uncultured Tenacibaculum sp.]|uniref:Ig-like domain-containing protein n=1 Tax=uncultured Tenacibaculum sp. TaxID=174713 RepID=UPI00262742BB|nr:Ig-like domain-containing protein [uncultured Tenacibaculum sp.]
MKQLSILLLSIFLLQSCVQDDIINDRVDASFSITNPITEITLNDTFQLTTKYTDNVGKTVTTNITWSSSNEMIATVSNSGLVTAVAQGQATIMASIVSEEGETITDEIVVTVTMDQVDNNTTQEKTGTIRTTSSYVLEGTFTLREIPNTNNLELVINDNYRASSSLPGLYIYLTNNPNTVNNAKEIQAVRVFNGAHTYIIEDTGINDFSHILYWCKPFSVKVGEAEIQ